MIEVLVVDNLVDAGKAYARMIAHSTGLGTHFTDDADEALLTARTNHLKVAVLDQRMPRITGTRLFQQLREIEPHLRGILLSGQAGTADLAEAMEQGFATFLDKNNVAQLADVVRSQHLHYLAELAARRDREAVRLGTYRSRPSLRGSTVRLELVSLERAIDGKDIVLDGSFTTTLKLDAGQTTRRRLGVKIDREVVFEEESADSNVIAMTVRPNLLADIHAKIERKVRTQQRTIHRGTMQSEEEQTLSLPQAADANSVRSRHFQTAPIYRRSRATLRLSCECCGVTHYISRSVLIATGRARTRQVDYLGNGTSLVVDTGDIELGK